MCRYRQSVRDNFCYPSLLLLPVLTFFTFRATKKDGQVRVSFSKYYTLANVALSVPGYVTYAAVTAADYTGSEIIDKKIIPAIHVIASLLLTHHYLFLDCFFPCCLHSPARQESVMLPSDPLVEYVNIRVGGKKVVIPIYQM